jgi:hypothetical protein
LVPLATIAALRSSVTRAAQQADRRATRDDEPDRLGVGRPGPTKVKVTVTTHTAGDPRTTCVPSRQYASSLMTAEGPARALDEPGAIRSFVATTRIRASRDRSTDSNVGTLP